MSDVVRIENGGKNPEAPISEDNWPIPVGWRILIDPLTPRSVSDGGIILGGEAVQAETFGNYIGRVVAMGPLCYEHAKFQGGAPWCKVGDWVAFGQHSGQPVRVRDDKIMSEIKSLSAQIEDLNEKISGAEKALRDALGSDEEIVAEMRSEIAGNIKQRNELRARETALQDDVERRLRLVNDDEILATIPDPDVIRIYI